MHKGAETGRRRSCDRGDRVLEPCTPGAAHGDAVGGECYNHVSQKLRTSSWQCYNRAHRSYNWQCRRPPMLQPYTHRSCNRQCRRRRMLQPYTAEATTTCARVATVLVMLQLSCGSCNRRRRRRLMLQPCTADEVTTTCARAATGLAMVQLCKPELQPATPVVKHEHAELQPGRRSMLRQATV